MTIKFKMSEMTCEMKIGPFWIKAKYDGERITITSDTKLLTSKQKEELYSDFINNWKEVITKYEENPRAGIMSD